MREFNFLFQSISIVPVVVLVECTFGCVFSLSSSSVTGWNISFCLGLVFLGNFSYSTAYFRGRLTMYGSRLFKSSRMAVVGL